MRDAIGVAALAALTILVGCGSDAEPAEAEVAESEPQVQPVALVDALAEIPPEELYGAPAAANLWSPRIELETLELPPGWDGARIAILSDFHVGLWEENAEVARAAIELAVAAQTEIVLLLGDYVDDASHLGELRQILAPLGGRRAFAVLGDRDVRSDSLAAGVVSALQSAGVRVLRNEAAAVVLNGDTAWIAGLDPELLDMGGGDQTFIVSTLGETGRTPILATHLPGLAARAPAGRYPIVLAGNTFCGDIEIPVAPRRLWVEEELFPGGAVEGTERLFRVRAQTVVISCGLGYGFVPVRFGAPPEVPLLTVRRLSVAADSALTRPAVEDSVIQRFEGAPRDTL